MSIRRLFFFLVVAIALLLATGTQTTSLNSNGNPENTTGLIAGRNVNMVPFPCIDPVTEELIPHTGDPYLQRQNEPSIAVSTRNPLHLFAGANDYRSIDYAMEDKLPGFEGTNLAPAPDAWLGVFKSIDGGSTWTSTLLPGFYYMDTTPQDAPSSPLWGFSAAADPVVRAGPNGLFFFAGIVFNREDRGDSAVFVSRFIDNNNKENVDTTAYIDTQIQARGSAGQFIDKPWLAVDVPHQEPPSISIPSPDPDIGYQLVTRCNVYLAYSVFLGNAYKTPRTKIYFARSTDSGESWENPTKLTETQHINQGATIAIDPRGKGHVWVAWRRFAHMNRKGKIIQPDAIVVVKSEDGGATFTKPHVVAKLAPWLPPSDEGVFDQLTEPESFRTNDYPTMAVDHNGTPYIAWTQRGFGPNIDPDTGVGEARIVMTTLNDGKWSTPEQVISNAEGDPPGHQLMPQLTYAAGKLTLLWYDQRWDVIRLFLPFIQDIYTNARHTIDVRVAQAEIHSYPEFSPSIQVSKYPFVIFPREDDPDKFQALQLLYNKPNLPLFSLGTVPFMGDYIGIAPSPMFLPPEDPKNDTPYWIYNTDSSVPTIYHAVWTDNRDVVNPSEKIEILWTGELPELGDWTQYFAPVEGCENGNWTGVRNQNIYTSRITEGIFAGSPGNTKPLDILRSFVVFVQNTTREEKFFNLRIQIPEGYDDLLAYFWQQGGGQAGELLDVFVPPYSYVSKTILVGEYSSDIYASIIIDVFEVDDPAVRPPGVPPVETYVSYITLNPDSTNPIIVESEGTAPGNPLPKDGETHTLRPLQYMIVDWDYVHNDPYINTIRVAFEDELIVNNDGVTPYPVESDLDNPHGRNPHGRNPHGRNPHGRNPHGRNNLLNPHGRNTNLSEIADVSHMTDVVWTIENAGNTTTSYSINTFETPEELPNGVLAQLIVFKTYTTPSVEYSEDESGYPTMSCELIEQEHQEMIVNLTLDPESPNLSELGDVSVTVPPNGVFHVLYRYYNPYQSPEQQEFHDEEKYEDAVPDIVSDVPDTDPENPNQPLPELPKLLVIPPQALLDGIVGDDTYSEILYAEGGTGSYGNWIIIDVINGDLPDGLSLNPVTGEISGTPQACGTFGFTVQVTDLDGLGDPLPTAKKKLWITVYYKIEASAGPGGAIDPSGTIKVECGASQTFTITSDSANGYYIADVLIDGTTSAGSVTEYTFNSVAKNYTIEAQFSNIYTLNAGVLPVGTGTVTPDEGSYIYEETAQVTAVAYAGYIFNMWTGDVPAGHEQYNPLSLLMDGNKTVTANFYAIVACTYSLSPTEDYFSSAASNGSVQVTTAVQCTWTAVKSDSWISITSGSPGVGNGTFDYSVTENTSSDIRVGTIDVEGITFTVHQSGNILTPPILTDTLSPGGSLNEPNKMAILPAGEAISKVDIMFLFDLTASMGGQLSTAKTSSGTIMNDVRGLIPDSEFGVISFMDYPDSFNWHGCAYGGSYSATYGDASFGDYPYSLDQAVTTDTALVTSAITSLSLGYGADGPESYSRVLYELYADPPDPDYGSVGWRPDAKKIAILFCDNIPHDPAYSKGLDPGRDAEQCTDDDLYFTNAPTGYEDVVAGLVANGITVLVLDSGSDHTPWTFVTQQTGGDLYQYSNVSDIPQAIVTLIEAEVQTIDLLTLSAETDYEGWISFTPSGGYSDVTPGESGTTRTFNLTITVPGGTATGTYMFRVELVADGVPLGWQIVTITIVTPN